jgi:hypothetical protein
VIATGVLGMLGMSALFAQADLQGVWVSNIATPLQRPPALAGRPTLTGAEVAELQKRANRIIADPNNDFLLGDAVFLSAFNNVDHYQNIGVTDHTYEMIPRVFENRTSLITDPPDGRIPPLTAGAQARRPPPGPRRKPDSPADLNPVERCITFGVPRVGGDVGAGTYSYYQIFQTQDYVVFFQEMIHEARIIPLDGRPHLSSSIHLWQGDSVGHWEGKTLVVDTANLPSRGAFMGAGPKLHLIEKFTRVSDKRLDYEVTLADPETWTKPWTVMIPYQHSDEKIFEFACHEGNGTVMKGMLEGGQ